ncbi:coiled-coil domain-containing protein 9 isoform X2 [Channa argus]|uniref:coiled-coil domain-containing protein 9 isoform X2 n=1 Tax=Channa argus TaxID=215402 RepID=UPI0035206BA4
MFWTDFGLFGLLRVMRCCCGSAIHVGIMRTALIRLLELRGHVKDLFRGTGSQPLVYEEKSEGAMSSVVDLKTKEEKDAELDKRIEALRKKNEALVKRYQEIEEDKKKAEQEGIAVTTPRKPRPHEPELDRRKTEKENFTVTVDLSKPTGEKRIVNDWKHGTPRGRKTSEESDGHRGQSDGHRGQSDGHNDGHRGQSDSHSPSRRTGSGRVSRGGHRGGGRQERREWEPRTPRDGEPGDSGGQGRRGGRRGRGGEGGVGGTPGAMDRKSKEWEEKRRQNIEKMNEEMERIAEYERGQRPDGDRPIRNFLDDPRRSGPVPDTDRKEGSRRHVRNWGGLDFDNVKTGAELEKEWTSRRPGPKSSVDMTMSMTGRERAEYLRWKKEREQIDEERLARHRNATGQWRREWDAQKTENMFKEDPCVAAEGITSEQGGSRRDDSKRPPKATTFGEILSQSRGQGPRGDRIKGKGRGQKQSYSMHDNRWEGEKEEEEKEDKTKKEEKTIKKEKEKEEEKPKPPTAQKVEEKSREGEDDDDEWEDASDGEDVEEGSDSEHDSRVNEKKDPEKEKPAKGKDSSPTSPKARSRQTSAGSPKEQRAPRPKVHIPPPASAQDSAERVKPLSPFSPFDGHQPVSDWGEAMEMQSPRSSMGGESPLKPPSIEASPPQKQEQQEKEKEMENSAANSSEPAEPQKEEHTDDSSLPIEDNAQQTLTSSEPQSVPSDPPAVLLSHHSPSEVSDPEPSAFSVPVPSEVCEAPVTVDQDTPASSKPQDKLDTPPSPTIPEPDQSSSAAAEREDGDMAPAETETAPTAETEEPSEQASSG